MLVFMTGGSAMTEVWVNGQQGCQVNPLERGLAYGDGLFATMRFCGGEVLFLQAHLQRLTQGAKRLGFDWCASGALIAQVAHLAMTHDDGCIKLLLGRGVGGRGYAAPTSGPITEIVSLHTIPSYYSQWQNTGISLKSSEVKLAHQPLLAGIKHLNRLEQVLIKSKTLPSGFEDWLVMDQQRNVIESSMANLFLVDGNNVVTPSIALAGVAGVMREQVIYALVAQGFELHINDVSYQQLSQFEHGFITNSLFGLVDINRIDDLTYTRSPFTHSIRHSLHLTL